MQLEVWLRGKGCASASGSDIYFSRLCPRRGPSRRNGEPYAYPLIQASCLWPAPLSSLVWDSFLP